MLFCSSHGCCIIFHKPRAFHINVDCFVVNPQEDPRVSYRQTDQDLGPAGLPASCCPFPVRDRKNNSQWCHEDKCHTAFAPYEMDMIGFHGLRGK